MIHDHNNPSLPHDPAQRLPVLPPDVSRETGIGNADLQEALLDLDLTRRPHLRRLWSYYRNTATPIAVSAGNLAERPYRQEQEWGLPARITGTLPAGGGRLPGISRKEVVVENDIAWRIDTMVDHLFGRQVFIASLAPDPSRRDVLTRLLAAILDANGGIALLQQLALLGAVYGYVDILVKLDNDAAAALQLDLEGDTWAHLTSTTAVRRDATGSGEATPAAPSTSGGVDAGADASSQPNTGTGKTPDGSLIERLARLVRFEIVPPSRALPLGTDTAAPAQPAAYAQVWETSAILPASSTSSSSSASAAEPRRWWPWAPKLPPTANPNREVTRHIEILTGTQWLRFTGPNLVARGRHPLGRVPVVHIQNLAVPFTYPGRSDVEPLMPLQDELNTRLSDRAYRISMSSFKMFLGKGIDNFLTAPVGPGRMWATDNTDAEIDEFGGDDRCPSEELHISEVREALDKVSAVPPVAAGLLRDRVGQLSSAAALRVTLQALLAKTERKRGTYGRGLMQMLELALAWLNATGLLPTSEDERRSDINWPSAIPENSLDRLREAEIKARLGVPTDQVLREIGY
jgi:hypothetical protein